MYKSITERLKENNYKLTDQRMAVLQVMLENKGHHLTAEEVLREARLKSPNIGIATIYRTLEKLAGISILHKTMFEAGKYSYELSVNHAHQHHHFVCLNCGMISEIEEDLLFNLEQHIEQQGYQIIDHELKLYGYCPKCRPQQ
ncbi:MAG TPA: Fur family transcriptional regulator [Syntrophomonadaceae bacterium]|nr:Fur family transcriptional regulator [Syntrophomonadaceae bacterium]